MRGEVEGRRSRLLASLATNSITSTVNFFPQVNPEGGMRAGGAGEGRGAEHRTSRM